jgi:RecA-family ATPase
MISEDGRRMAAATYLEQLTGDANSHVVFQVFDDTPAKDPRKAAVLQGTLSEHWDRLQRLNDDGCGIFLTVNESLGGGRKKEDITRVRAILADDDDGVNTFDGFPLRPHMAVRSSVSNGVEKCHYYWRVEDGNLDEYDGVIERLVQSHKVCAGSKGLNRVLRLPGFYHKKDPNNPQLVEIVRMSDDSPYPWSIITKAFPPLGNGHGKPNKLQEAYNSDPVLNHLRAGGYVKEEHPDGKIHIICPFEEQHTQPSSVSSTTYFVAHTNGYKFGHFKCQHGHCEGRTREDFLAAVGYRSEESESDIERLPSMDSLKITAAEWTAAKLTPACIVKNYLYCDVGVITAPGGTGKTTQLLYEMACIVLNRPIYGLDICRTGRCLYITAEDSREILIARLREIVAALELTAHEQQTIRGSVIFLDVTSQHSSLIQFRNGNIELTPMADKIVSTYRNEPPALLTFDPAMSFGASERMVNDNGQGLITAARRIVRGLGCCVRFVAHTGIVNARNKAMDQYATRGGGSALVDGTRMCAIMQSWKPGDKLKPPAGIAYSPESSITVLSRPKLSYAPPNLPLIWIKRTGWAFECATEIPVSDEDQDKALLDQVERFIHSEARAGHYHSKKSLEESMMQFGLTRSKFRGAVERLIAHGQVVMADLPKENQKGNWKTYLTTFELAQKQKTGGELV